MWVDIIPRSLSLIDSSSDVLALSPGSMSLSLGLCLVFGAVHDQWDCVVGSH